MQWAGVSVPECAANRQDGAGRDAREAITQLVDALNQTGQGFRFDKDLVLKAGLVMTDAGGIGFKVMNLNQANMAQLETNWERIERALRIAARLMGLGTGHPAAEHPPGAT